MCCCLDENNLWVLFYKYYLGLCRACFEKPAGLSSTSTMLDMMSQIFFFFFKWAEQAHLSVVKKSLTE